MDVADLIEALENARVSDDFYLSGRESEDELVASVDGLCVPIESVDICDGQVIIHLNMYDGIKNK